jgi:dTDP-4-amino-4,6-dideoxygalactose transaminase
VDVEMMAATANAPVSRGKPILAPVHFAGIAVDMQRLDGLLTNPDAVVIEDAAHAVGSFYSSQGPRVGSCAWSHMTIFSLHPAKTMTTGEGGIVTTNHEEYYHALQLFRNNCIERDPKYLNEEPRPWYYEVVDLSNNYNFTTFQAALGRSQLSRIETFVTKRRQLMQQYREKFKDFSSIKLFTDDRDPYTAFHLCVAQIDFAHCKTDRKSVMDQLKEEGIGTQVHYIPLYRHPYFKKKLGDLSLYFPETEAYYEQALSLPLYFDLSLDDVDRIAETLIRILKHSLLRPS